jgi:UDP-2,3-diacylglucosamine pyrophosphatase LpxH
MTTEHRCCKYRTVFLSDLHLGSPHSKVGRLLSFLERIEFETLVLVGDLFDAPGMVLPDRHKVVLAHILERLTSGGKIIFVPGNHDRVFRDIIGEYGRMHVVNNYVHTTASGKTIFVTHGDEWDSVGSLAVMHLIDRKLPFPYWEIIRKFLQGFMRRHIATFERRALNDRLDNDMILCGHVHFPAFKENYLNCGDWVKHCSAIVEHLDGRLELVYG